MALIGFVGYKGSGKDTAFKLLKELHEEADPHFVMKQYSFAYAVRKLAQEITNIDMFTDYDETKEIKMYPGPLGQVWSKRDWVRAVGEGTKAVLGHNVWVDAVESQICADAQEVDDAGITDVRFMQEAHKIIGMGGMLVYIDRGIQHGEDTHVSEIHIADLRRMCDMEISNLGTMEELKATLATKFSF